MVREVAVTRGVDEDPGADRAPAGLGLDQQRVDAAVGMARDTGSERVEQQLDAGSDQQRVGRALERGHVVGLRVDLPEDQVRLVEPVERAHAIEQLVGDAVHHLADLAVHVGVQAAEVGDAGGRAHAAEKAVALDQQHARAVALPRPPPPRCRPGRRRAPTTSYSP